MKYSIIIFILVISRSISFGQFATQSAEGKSSLPLPLNGAGVSVDIGKAEIVMGLNNYGRVFDSIRNVSFWGISLAAKNSDGLANLFNAGNIVGEGNLTAIVGYSFSNNTEILKEYNNSKLYDTINMAIDSAFRLFTKAYPDSVRFLIRSRKNLITNSDLQNIVMADLIQKIDSARPDLITDLLKGYRSGDSDLKVFMDTIRIYQESIFKFFASEYGNIQQRIQGGRTKVDLIFAKSVTPWRLSVFLQGGIKARSFKRYLSTVLPDFNKSFQDTLYRGGHFGLGANFQIGDFTFGLTYSYLKSDNFANLTSKDYTLRTTDTSGNQAFLQEKKITAYSGKYSRVEVNEFNADLLYSIKLDKNDSSRLLLNPYIRGSWSSRDTSFLPNYTNIGIGAYFLGKKRKFIGGLYVELPDVNNNAEKSKPITEQNIQAPFKRLTFGIVTKININSIFAFADKPRKPD